MPEARIPSCFHAETTGDFLFLQRAVRDKIDVLFVRFPVGEIDVLIFVFNFLDREIRCDTHFEQDFIQRAIPHHLAFAVAVRADCFSIAIAPDFAGELAYFLVATWKSFEAVRLLRLATDHRCTRFHQLSDFLQNGRRNRFPIRQHKQSIAHAIREKNFPVAEFHASQNHFLVHIIVIITVAEAGEIDRLCDSAVRAFIIRPLGGYRRGDAARRHEVRRVITIVGKDVRHEFSLLKHLAAP